MHRFLTARLLILLVLLFALEHTLAPLDSLLGGRIDLLYLLVLDYAFFWSWERVAFFAILVGLGRDFLGGHLFGVETASLALTGFLLHLGMQKLERENVWVRLGLAFLFVGLTEVLSLALAKWLEVSKTLVAPLMEKAVWTTLYTTALAPGFFWLTQRWFKRVPVLRQYELFSR